eukprot:7417530-Karenia_brevis.AAC.1
MLPDSVKPAKRAQTWITAAELLSANGFPVSKSSQEASGVVCVFSEGHRVTPGRSHRSQRQQSGNAMHVNSTGK